MTLWMTRPHLGTLPAVLGTVLLAFSVKVRRQYGEGGPLREVADRAKRDGYTELTETTIARGLFWAGLVCVALGSLLQW
jgi:hypothetical protein